MSPTVESFVLDNVAAAVGGIDFARIVNALKRAGIYDVETLATFSRTRLADVGLRPADVDAIASALARTGIQLAP